MVDPEVAPEKLRESGPRSSWRRSSFFGEFRTWSIFGGKYSVHSSQKNLLDICVQGRTCIGNTDSLL